MALGKKLKRKKTTAVAELPEEVVHREILTRLPIKSAVRFKCVSKSWLFLFSTPQFVKQHLTHNSAQNPNDYDCLIAKKQENIVILSRYKETSAIVTNGFVLDLVGSVRGLVCLRHASSLSLCNPAIHQSKEFSIPPRRPRHWQYPIGFGFDPISENYKVVVLSRDLKFACVYYSNSDVWVDIFVPDNVLLENRGKLFKSSSTIVKDCPYWTFTRNSNNKYQVYLSAVKFDTGSNEFKLLPNITVPEVCLTVGYEFVDMNDCPTVIVYDRYSTKCMLDMYSLNGENECCVWKKMYRIGPLDFGRRYVSLLQGFYGGEIVFQDHKTCSCYDRKTDTIKRLTTVPLGGCCRYTPSLVLLEGMKSVYLTAGTCRTTALCSRVPRQLLNSLINKSFA